MSANPITFTRGGSSGTSGSSGSSGGLPPIQILSYSNLTNNQYSTSTSGITAKVGYGQIGIVTNLPVNTVLSEIKLGINTITTPYQAIDNAGATFFQMPAVFNLAGGASFANGADVSITIKTADGRTGSAATGPGFVHVTL